MTRRLAQFAQSYALPDGDALRLLRIALGIGKDAHSRESFHWAISRIGNGESGLRWLMPLLAAANAVAEGIEPEIQAKLQAALLYEKQRSQRFDEIAATAIARVGEGGGMPLISRGLALAQTTYPCREARHNHDLDLIVRDIAAAREAMEKAGFDPIPGETCFRHTSGMTAKIYASPFPEDGGHHLDNAFWERASKAELAGEPVLLASPTDVLLHTILLPTYFHLGHATWIVDSWFALRRDLIDWDALSSLPASDRIFVARALNLLAKELDAPVPAEALSFAGRLNLGESKDTLKRMARWKGRKALLREGAAFLLRPS